MEAILLIAIMVGIGTIISVAIVRVWTVCLHIGVACKSNAIADEHCSWEDTTWNGETHKTSNLMIKNTGHNSNTWLYLLHLYNLKPNLIYAPALWVKKVDRLVSTQSWLSSHAETFMSMVWMFMVKKKVFKLFGHKLIWKSQIIEDNYYVHVCKYNGITNA